MKALKLPVRVPQGSDAGRMQLQSLGLPLARVRCRHYDATTSQRQWAAAATKVNRRRVEHGPARAGWQNLPQLEITVEYLRGPASCWPASGDRVDVAAARQRLAALAERPPRGTRSQPVDILSTPPPPSLNGAQAVPRKTRCEWVWRASGESRQSDASGDAGLLFYIHGGGFIAGSTATHKGLISRLLAATGEGVYALSVDYRLAPEHRQPAAAEDVWAAFWWLAREKRVDPRSIVVAGDSAGAGLAAGLVRALSRADSGAVSVAGLLLLSPWLDLSCSGASYALNATTDHITPEAVQLAAALYTAADTDTDTDFAPSDDDD